jgi:WD40 repeat protein
LTLHFRRASVPATVAPAGDRFEELAPGAVLAARFLVVEELGRGATGVVFRAEDRILGRHVALKVFRGEGVDLLDEARATAAVAHPSVATIHEVCLGHRPPFVVMELVAGRTLAVHLQAGRMDVARALHVAGQVASGLAEIHARGLVHGDLSAGNVMLDDDGVAKVLDFGLSRRSAGHESTGRISGSLGYLAPERLGGAPSDPRTDVFALGVILFEMFAGRRPFDRDGRQDAWATLHEEAPVLALCRGDVPVEIESIVRRCLEKDRPRRFADAAGVSQAIEAARRPGPPTGAMYEPAQAPAFRGLLPFQEADHARFFGRDADENALFARLTGTTAHFVVLYGASGTGKSSLLRAGLIPRLWRSGFYALYARSLGDPLALVAQEAERRSGLAMADEESLASFLVRLARSEATEVVVVLDQLEELFARGRSREERAGVVEFLGACGSGRLPGVRVLLAIRDDFLHLVASELGAVVPDPLASGKIQGLRSFDREEARLVVARSAAAGGLALEDALVDAMVDDLATEGTVLPCELQIVGDRLQAGGTTTLAAYRRAGGKEALVHAFLEDVVQHTGRSAQAWLVLRSLVSEEGTRRAVSATEVAETVRSPESAVRELLDHFVAARLVREVQSEDSWCYELMHEYLVRKINEVTGRVVSEAQRANRLLRQYLSAHASDPAARIPVVHALFIWRHGDVDAGPEGKALVRGGLRRGVLQLAGLLFAVSFVAGALAAVGSVRDEWVGRRLTGALPMAVREIAFSPDGRRLASACADGSLVLWDVVARTRLKTVQAHQSRCYGVAFSPDGRLIASGGRGPDVAVWDGETLERQHGFEAGMNDGRETSVTGVAFSPFGEWLAAANNRSTTVGCLWRVRDGALVQRFPGVSVGDAGIPVFLPSGRVWFGGMLCEMSSARCEEWLAGGNDQAVWPDGSKTLTIDPSGRVEIRRLPGFAPLAMARGHRDHGRAIALSPDGKLVASAAEDVVLWNASTLEKIARLQRPSIVWSLAFSPDGRHLASSHADGSITFWDVAERRRAFDLGAHAGNVNSVAAIPGRKAFVSASSDGSLIVWDAVSGSPDAVLRGHDTVVNAVSVTPDGRWAASCDQDGGVALWDLAARRRDWHRSADPCYATAVPVGAPWVAATQGIFRERGRDLFHPEGWLPNIYALAISPDGRRLCAVSHGLEMMVFDTTSWRLLDTWKGPGLGIRALAFTADGRKMLSGDYEGHIRLWNASPLRLEAEIGRHDAGVTGLALRPGEREVICSSADRSIAVWSIGGRRLLARVALEPEVVSSIALSDDGLRLAAGVGENVRVYAWHRTLWGHRLGPR